MFCSILYSMLQCYTASIRCYSHYSHAILLLVHLNHFGPKIELSQWAVNPGAMASRQGGRVVCGVLLLCLMICLLCSLCSSGLWLLSAVGEVVLAPPWPRPKRLKIRFKYQNLP